MGFYFGKEKLSKYVNYLGAFLLFLAKNKRRDKTINDFLYFI